LPYPSPVDTDADLPYPSPVDTDADLPYPSPVDTDADLPHPSPVDTDADLPYPSPVDTDADLPHPSPVDTDADLPYPSVDTDTANNLFFSFTLLFTFYSGTWPSSLSNLLSPRLVGTVKAKNHPRISLSRWTLCMSRN